MEDNSTPPGAEEFNTQPEDAKTTVSDALIETGLVEGDGKTVRSAFEAKGGVYVDEDQMDLGKGEDLAEASGAEVVATDQLLEDNSPMEIEEVV